MSSITQAKAEAQKLIKQYNKLQAEAKNADTIEAGRKAAEAEKLVAQISSLQAAIAKLQAKDREKTTVTASPEEIGTNNLRAIESEKAILESRIERIESAQKKTREQIDQLNRAKRELMRLRSEAEQNKERRTNDEKLLQKLSKLIDQKESEQGRLKQEVELIRQQAQKDAELLKVQRDAARAMMERQKQLELEKSHVARKKTFATWFFALFGIGIGVAAIAGLALFTPVFDDLLGKGQQVLQTTETQQTTAQSETKEPETKNLEEQVDPIDIKSIYEYRDALSKGGYGPVMVHLPGGSYLMGSKDSLPYSDERSQHKVTLQAFSIGKYEVTFEEYDLFANETGRKLPDDQGWGRDNRPVINVTWDDAVEYSRWLTEQSGFQYRLPSEREWEFAAAANTTTTYWWGYDIAQNMANCAICGSQWDGRQTAPVGSFRANAFGVHDTIGNILEWTSTCFHASYKDSPNYGQNWEGGDCSKKMVRSSAYRTPESGLRTTKRNKYTPKTKMDSLGFRVARVE